MKQKFTRFALAAISSLAFASCDKNKDAYETWRKKNGGDLESYLKDRMDKDLTFTRMRALDNTDGRETADQTALSQIRRQAYGVTRALALSQMFNDAHNVDRLMHDGWVILAQTMFKADISLSTENAALGKTTDIIVYKNDAILVPPKKSYEYAYQVILNTIADTERGEHIKIRLNAP